MTQEAVEKFFKKSFKPHNFLKVKADVLSNIVTYLPSLTSSIKARPAFFCIEFCHSWEKKQAKTSCIKTKLGKNIFSSKIMHFSVLANLHHTISKHIKH